MNKFYQERVAVLDGLRALAIILVLMRHGAKPFWWDLNQPFLKIGSVEFGNFFMNGWMGVDLFFVLSGFLITSHLLGRYFDSNQKRIDYKSYLKRRFLRIAPAYYVVLTIAVLGLFPFYPYPHTMDNIGWRYIYHLGFMQDYWPSDIVTVFWSLAIEMKFYLLAPLLVILLMRLSHTSLRLGALVLLLASYPVIRYYWTLSHPDINVFSLYFEEMRSIFHLSLDGLTVGMIAAFIMNDKIMKKFISKKMTANILFFGGAAGFIFLSGTSLLLDQDISLFDKTLLPPVIALSFGAMLLGLLGGTSAAPAFAWKGWLPVAVISYSLYLLHLPLMYSAEVMCRQFINLDALGPQLQMAVYFPFFILISVFFSTVCYIFVERPFLLLGKRRSNAM